MKQKKTETNGKKLIENQKKLLSLFDNLKTIFSETVYESSNNNTKNESKSDNEIDYESDNERDNKSKKDKYYYEIRQLNNRVEIIRRANRIIKGKGRILK